MKITNSAFTIETDPSILISEEGSPVLSRKVIQKGYDQKSCWVHTRCGLLSPDEWTGGMVVTMQKSHMGVHEDTWDVFSGLSMMKSHDKGRTWTHPMEIASLGPWSEGEGTRVVISDFTSQWHAASRRLLGIGHTCRYRDGKLMAPPRPRETAYSVYDAGTESWSPVKLLEMGDRERFFCSGAGCAQWVELSDGDILLPIYFKDRETSSGANRMNHVATRVMVLRCRFDGETLTVLEEGNELITSAYRGYGEPSLIASGGRFWMTIRNGKGAYVSVSDDGLYFSDPEPWRFDDGSELGSYDTQQHWLALKERLFLVYTRSGVNNDHIVRHRAPLLMAEVDQERQCLLRETEREVVPERGAQLGNFGITQGADNDAWICASEWMETGGRWSPFLWEALERKFPEADLDALAALPGRCGLCELGGSDNSVHLVHVGLR